ncbi:hypothetical protein EUA02_14035 [Mycobacterium paragordonae]|nr:MAG: hypothetical protein CK431_15425 [Mycobacterium sp.]TDK96210.1 hypothetical protein EUA02_14035 [Mycobacterium paragordonae]TDK97658.1 hypothetical protein EI067_11480 [Mycobacterium paragordonae]TDL08082.1 hypothetical protein EUA05_12075 [Mycobacterium paragordonae]
MSRVTPALTTGTSVSNKRPACRWLRSSSYNSAVQSSIVTKSLCEKIQLCRPASESRARGARIHRRSRQCVLSERVFAGMFVEVLETGRLTPTGRTAA